MNFLQGSWRSGTDVRMGTRAASREHTFRAIYEQHGVSVHAYVARRVADAYVEDLVSETPGDAPGGEDDTTRLDVRAAVRRLPARQQEAVVLHYLLDLPVTDTAAAMGCDQGTVKTHLSRARAALLTALSVDDEPVHRRGAGIMADRTLLKERLQQAAEVTAPARRLDDVVRRSRVLRWRRAGATALVACVVAAAFVASLSALQGLDLNDRHDTAGGRVGAIGFPATGWSMAASTPASPDWPPTVWVTNVPFARAISRAHTRRTVSFAWASDRR